MKNVKRSDVPQWEKIFPIQRQGKTKEAMVCLRQFGSFRWQSKWDQCLFIKWVSATSYIYVPFHVDDIMEFGTIDVSISKVEQHRKSKYAVTSSSEGVLLGIRIRILPHGDGSCIYLKDPVCLSLRDLGGTDKIADTRLNFGPCRGQ